MHLIERFRGVRSIGVRCDLGLILFLDEHAVTSVQLSFGVDARLHTLTEDVAPSIEVSDLAEQQIIQAVLGNINLVVLVNSFLGVLQSDSD